MNAIEDSTFYGEVCVLCEAGWPPRWFKYDICVAVCGRAILFAGVTCVEFEAFYPVANCI